MRAYELLVVGALCTGILACHEEATPLAPQPAALRSSAAAVVGSRYSRPDEDAFVDLAKEIPSSAGFFIDSLGRTVVSVADPADDQAAMMSVQQHASRGELGLSKSQANNGSAVRRAKFTFQELSDWRDLAYERVLNMPGVAFDDLDEVRNRVTIGISGTPKDQAEVLKQLLAAGVPAAAINFEPATRSTSEAGERTSKFSAAMDPGGSLAGAYTVLGGGYEVYQNRGGCTATFIGVFDNARVLGATQHCSGTLFTVDGSPVSPPDAATTAMGTETADPSATSSYCATLVFNCYRARNSDGDLYTLNGFRQSQVGVISRPSVRQHALLTNPQLQVDPVNPWFYVAATDNGQPPVGAVVEKVGRTTGWTWGTVSASCVDLIVPSDNYAIRCATKADMWSGDGDSGAPIFTQVNPSDPSSSSITLLGALGGGDGATTTWNSHVVSATTWYSGYSAFASELGVPSQHSLNVITDILKNPVLSGSVSSGLPVLSWTSAAGNGVDGPITYRVLRSTWNAVNRTFTESGYLAASTQSLSWTDTSPPYSFGAPSAYQPDSCFSWSSYMIVALIHGVGQGSNTLYYQGPRRSYNTPC